MTATYGDETQVVDVIGEVHPEASCAVTIDDINTRLSGEILLSPDSSDFGDATQLYRYHILESVYAQVTISNNPAPITAILVDSFTLTQNGNTFDQSFAEFAANGNQLVLSFVLDDEVQGTIAGITTTLTIDLIITYGDGTVRRRRLQAETGGSDSEKLEHAGASVSFIIQTAGCSAPTGHPGEVIRSTCQYGDAEEIRHCERGRWALLSSLCPEPPKCSDCGQIVVTSTSSSQGYTWEILFFSVLFAAIAAIGYAFHIYCMKSPDKWVMPSPKAKHTTVIA